MQKIRILFLVANPFKTTLSELDAKMHAIRDELRNFRNLVFDAEWVAGVDDLREALKFYQPHVVHFIGEAGSLKNDDEGKEKNDAEARKPSQKSIVLPVQAGELKPVADLVLKYVFGGFSERIRLVVLDGCYTDEQANVLSTKEGLDCVIGVSDSPDALWFVTVFYSCISGGTPFKRLSMKAN